MGVCTTLTQKWGVGGVCLGGRSLRTTLNLCIPDFGSLGQNRDGAGARMPALRSERSLTSTWHCIGSTSRYLSIYDLLPYARVRVQRVSGRYRCGWYMSLSVPVVGQLRVYGYCQDKSPNMTMAWGFKGQSTIIIEEWPRPGVRVLYTCVTSHVRHHSVGQLRTCIWIRPR